MIKDAWGVAGFFEDLPVLMFILAGTVAIVTSSVMASESFIEVNEDQELDALADRCAGALVSDILGSGGDGPVTVGSLCSTRLSRIAEDLVDTRDFRFSVVILHPDFRMLASSTASVPETVEHASSASRLFNALTDNGLIAILVVRVVVW